MAIENKDINAAWAHKTAQNQLGELAVIELNRVLPASL